MFTSGALVEIMVVALIAPPAWRLRADVELEVAVLMLLTMLDALDVSFA